MRTKTVAVANKNILITEKKIKELKELSKEINVDFNNFLNAEIEGKNTSDIATMIFELLENKITQIFPQLTEEDIEEAYISELEELVEGFIDVNFSGVKKVFSKVTAMM